MLLRFQHWKQVLWRPPKVAPEPLDSHGPPCGSLIQKEKRHLFSVGGFETETSNFGLNGCLRVSKNPKNYAGSNGLMLSALYIPFFMKNVFFDESFYKFPLYLLYDRVNHQFWHKKLFEGLKLQKTQSWIKWRAQIDAQCTIHTFFYKVFSKFPLYLLYDRVNLQF